MRTRLYAAFGLLGLGLSVVGCISLKRTPQARFFVLRSLVEPSPASEAPVASGLVGVLPVRLPEYLDRAQVVTWTSRGEVRIDEFLRWGEPLDAGVGRALSENLAALLPGHRLVRHPWPAATALRCRVQVVLDRFGPEDNGEVRLVGRWALLPARDERPLLLRPVSLSRGPFAARAGVPEAGVAVDAMSELVADFSREVAEAIRALPPDHGQE